MLRLRPQARKTDVIVAETKAGRRVLDQKDEVLDWLTKQVPEVKPVFYAWAHPKADGGHWVLSIHDAAGVTIKSKSFLPNGELAGGPDSRRKGKRQKARPPPELFTAPRHQPDEVKTVLEMIQGLGRTDREIVHAALGLSLQNGN